MFYIKCYITLDHMVLSETQIQKTTSVPLTCLIICIVKQVKFLYSGTIIIVNI